MKRNYVLCVIIGRGCDRTAIVFTVDVLVTMWVQSKMAPIITIDTHFFHMFLKSVWVLLFMLWDYVNANNEDEE